MKVSVLADPRLWGWLAIALTTGALLYALSPILAPFLAGAILAYVLNPLVVRLTGRFVPRVVAVVALALVIVPLFIKELAGGVLANNRGLVAGLLGSLKIGGLALIAFFVNILLVPVVLFFLLRDWASAALLVALRRLKAAYLAGPLLDGPR